MENNRFCFTGGGTGGHVYPSKPIIDILSQKQKDSQFLWIGSRGGMEESIVKNWNINYRGISSGKLRRYFSLRNITDIFRILSGFFQSRRILKKYRPQWLYSKGGFVSVPPVFAAKTLGIPVYSHDSDLDPGLATRLNAKKSKGIFLPYAESRPYYSKWESKIHVTGNPVREIFYNASAEEGRRFLKYTGKKPILLVVGGSSGAGEINKLVEDHLSGLCERYFVVHQMGQDLYKKSERDDYRTFAYINEELPHIMKAADLCLSRAGAGFLWELAATETPMILLPLTKGSRGDQVRNAGLFQKLGFAQVLEKENLTNSNIWDIFEAMDPRTEEGKQIMRHLKECPLPRAAERIYEIITGECQ